METKTNRAIALFKLGRYKEAFAIFKTFKRGFSKKQKRAIEIASECVNNLARCEFYESIGVDAKQLCVDAYCVIIDSIVKDKNRYGKETLGGNAYYVQRRLGRF